MQPGRAPDRRPAGKRRVRGTAVDRLAQQSCPPGGSVLRAV